jgi:hypothetical protein
LLARGQQVGVRAVTTRDLVLSCAAKLIGNYGKGSPEVYSIWRQVCDPSWTNAQVKQFADTQEWCGGSALCVYQNAGLTKLPWKMGLGFKDALGLKKVPWPQPGDLAIQDHKPYHHMIVEYWNHDNDWGDLAGNTPFYARHRHGSSKGIEFYSIEPLLETLPEAGFLRGQEFSVPGVQEKESPGGT